MLRRGLCYVLVILGLMLVGCDAPVPYVSEPSSTQFVSLEANLMAYYPFSGSARDESGWENHGFTQEAALVPDRFGNAIGAFHFDGIDDMIEAHSSKSLEIMGPITLAAWIYPEERKTQEIVVKGSRVRIETGTGDIDGFFPYGLALSATGDVIFSLSPNFQATQARKHGYPINHWFHVAGTYDGETMRLYVDGEFVAAESVTGTLFVEDAPLLIGTRLRLPSSTFRGSIDDVRIYDRALNEAEINLLADT